MMKEYYDRSARAKKPAFEVGQRPNLKERLITTLLVWTVQNCRTVVTSPLPLEY